MTDPTAAAAPVAAPAPAATPDPVASTLAPTPDPAPVVAPTAAPAPVASVDTAAPITPVTPPAAAAPATPATFPDDWRQRLAGTDEKTLKMLERLQSPEAMAKKLREQEVLISSGQIKKPLAANATPEQIAAYRTDNGIPDAPEKYFENLPDGLVIGAEDKPIFDDFAKTLHEKNIPPAAAHAAIEWYNKWQENNQALVAEVDRGNAQKTEDMLRQEWGADYRANANLRAAFLDTAPALVKDAFLRARLPDGSLLGEHADMSRWLVSMAREINPVASIPPSSGIGSGKSIEDRLGEIKPLMGNKNSEYWKGERGPDGKTSLEREYGQLLEVQLANKNRGG